MKTYFEAHDYAPQKDGSVMLSETDASLLSVHHHEMFGCPTNSCSIQRAPYFNMVDIVMASPAL